MFYPEDSLKRGGRFYLCWVADSWPLRFATITHRQLWSQDIRKICNDLQEVITNESGRPAKRFSLRLSSQLLRGVVRLYQRKVTVLLGDLCMINATVIKNANKKWVLHERTVTEIVHHPRLPLIVCEEPEPEQRIEELIQRSGNVVANIDEITLKEPTMPEIQLLINDGFGEMREGALGEQSVEAMRAGRLDPPTDLSNSLPHNVSHNKSHDRTRLASHDATRTMERISEHDITMFNKKQLPLVNRCARNAIKRHAIGMDLVQIEDLQKEIPEISEIPPPVLKDPQTTTKETELSEQSASEAKKRKAEEEIVLEDLQPEAIGSAKGRPRRGLLIDRRCKLDANQFRSKLDCPEVYLRCQDSYEDVVKIRVPANVYFSRPTQGGRGVRSNVSQVLSRMYARNLVVSIRKPLAEREMEEVVTRASVISHTRSQLERIEEELEENAPRVDMPIQLGDIDVNLTNVERMDIDVLPTQVVETLSRARKRASDSEIITKRRRTMGYISFRESQQKRLESEIAQEAEKENTPSNIMPIRESQKSVKDMLQEAGLADIPTSPRKATRKSASESSETPLGSLDRTKVSLGGSDKTTDSKTFIRDQWGTEGTMVKILKTLKLGLPLNVNTLVTKGPVIAGCRSIIAARCFTSILKLKQQGFIDLRKDADTLEIIDIKLGPRFEKGE